MENSGANSRAGNNLGSLTATETRTNDHSESASTDKPKAVEAKEKPTGEARGGQKHDYFGNTVVRGQKQHKIVFRDIVSGQQLAILIK